MSPVYAIVSTGGKQFRVEPGSKLRVESLPQAVGEQVALDKVLLVKKDTGLQVGAPHVAGAKVLAEVLCHDRERKIVVFKKRSKKTYKKTIGHRQNYTELLIKDILTSAQGSGVRAQEVPSEPGAQSPER